MRGIVTAKPLLSRAEQQLYGRLVRAFPGHVILAHAAVTRALVADFVVCLPDFTAIAVVELDEDAKPTDAQLEKNRRKAEALQAAGIKVIRVSAADIPNELALKALVAALPLRSCAADLMRRAS